MSEVLLCSGRLLMIGNASVRSRLLIEIARLDSTTVRVDQNWLKVTLCASLLAAAARIKEKGPSVTAGNLWRARLATNKHRGFLSRNATAFGWALPVT